MRIVIGKYSDGADYSIGVEQSHLFISYVHAGQIADIFNRVLKKSAADCQVFLSVAATLEERLSYSLEWTTLQSDASILDAVHAELVRRKRAKSIAANPSILVLIDNIWNWVLLANKKGRSNKLADMLTIASDYKIFLLAGSAISLRNMLTQLIDNNPRLAGKLKSDGFRPIGALGAELVFTAEDVVFYKKKGQADYDRLY